MPLPIHWTTGGNVRFADLSVRLEAASLTERHELLTFVRLHRDRICPRITDRWLVLEMFKYFLDCIAVERDRNRVTTDEEFDSPFDAARQMASWFNWYRKTEKDDAKIQNIANVVASFYREGNDFCRNCIETGFLEHVLETPKNRSFFQDWASDPMLADAHRESLKWGRAHEKTE